MTTVASSCGVSLGELARRGVGSVQPREESVVVRGVQHDSRSVVAGDLFVAVPGMRQNGALFAENAALRGAVAVATENPLEISLPQLLVRDAREALSRAAAIVYGDPTAFLRVIGITGTNGKTTVAWLVEHCISSSGGTPALMGTVCMRGPGFSIDASHTTPEADDIARFARRCLSGGATHLVMEVSSHALALGRADGVHFDTAVFTNLTQDHLDFHETLDAYGIAKARLFRELSPRAAVINVDDHFGATVAMQLPTTCTLVRCSKSATREAEVRALEWYSSRHGIQAEVETPSGRVSLTSPLMGEHNVENLLVTLGCAVALKADTTTWTHALATAKGAPGRMELVPTNYDVTILVDYAHTPDALAHALDALRPLTGGRLWVVFGCGGDRDRSKRAQMGEVAGTRADVCVITNDNPRSEDPAVIASEVVVGVERAHIPRVEQSKLSQTTRGYLVMLDRREAIRAAVLSARARDTVLIAGKGHETYQIIGANRFPFDDRVEAQAAVGGAP